MKKFICLKKIVSPNETVLLDTESGTFNVRPGSSEQVQGNYIALYGHEVSIFATDKNLFLQWGTERWNFKDVRPILKYEHDFNNKTTFFSVGDKAIRYLAWWADDPTFDPNLPERDEDEDFFGYVARLADDEQFRQVLIQSWDK
jgi:hypothetical protein